MPPGTTPYRTRDQVDIVLENRRGEVIAIEVKSSATPSPDDFRGIRHLHDSRRGVPILDHGINVEAKPARC